MKAGKDKDQMSERLQVIVADLKRYIEKRIELIMLNVGEYFSKWTAISVYRAAGVMFIFLGISFLFIALAIYIGNLVGNLSLGYVIVSIPLFILGFSFICLKPRLLFEELQKRFAVELIDAVEPDAETDPGRKGISE